MEDSSKHEFRAGDRVTWGTMSFSYIIESITDEWATMNPNTGRELGTGRSFQACTTPCACISKLTLVEPIEPVTKPLVRTETRLVIDEGDYDGVRVERAKYGGDINIGLVDEDDDSEVDMFDVDLAELRKIAKTITELADALEAGAVVA